LSLDADRTRRNLDEGRIFRLLYPAALLIPIFFPQTPLRTFSIAYGLLLLGLWAAGLAYVGRRGEFFHLPKGTKVDACWHACIEFPTDEEAYNDGGRSACSLIRCSR
jgi:hypothetical protein